MSFLPARDVFKWSQWRHVHEFHGLCGRRLYAAIYRRAKTRSWASINLTRSQLATSRGCSTVGIDEQVLTPVRIFPNPTAGVIRIDASALPGRRILIDLLDVTGRQLLPQVEVDGIEQSLDLSSFFEWTLSAPSFRRDGSTLVHRIALER